ncbi:MAG: hypothetical protein M8353_08700 [ANME-2 cluster archaeon]|nr:hypothetical protein [ANME-2 cluster archaeon]
MTNVTIQKMTRYLTGALILATLIIGTDELAITAGIEVPPEERAALVALYNAAGGSGWTSSTNWNNGDPCLNNWYGIVCSGGHIAGIQLQNNNLVGKIPPAIGDLSQLTTFWVYGNVFLGGTIPKQFGNLSQLQSIHMGFCNLSGYLPPEFGNLSLLTQLNLYTIQKQSGLEIIPVISQ